LRTRKGFRGRLHQLLWAFKERTNLEVQVSHKILPFLVELAEQFTTYSLTVAISLKAKYSQRFYEYCSQFKSTGFIHFNKRSEGENATWKKYSRYAQIKMYVIDVAHKELKSLYEAAIVICISIIPKIKAEEPWMDWKSS